MRSPRLMRIIGSTILTLALVGYGFFQARYLFIGSTLTIDTPLNGARVDSPKVTVSGTAERITSIKLNDRPISVDAEGRFSEFLLVSPGHSILEVTTTDRFGRSKEEHIHVIYQ